MTSVIYYAAFFSEKTFTQSQNQPPVAIDDSYTGRAARYQPAPGLLANDYDPDGANLSVGKPGFPGIVTQPLHGSVYLLYTVGSFSYSPTNGYTGDDSFVYNACDNFTCTPAIVTLIRANSAPIGGSDSYEGVAARFQPAPGLLANDSDPDGDNLQVGAIGIPPIVTYPAYGRVSLTYYDGSFSYTPTGGYTGIDSFVYNSCDSLGACTPTTVTLRANTAPVGVADSYSGLAARRQIAPGLLANDSDAEGDTLQVGAIGFPPIVTYPAYGRVSLTYYDGSFSYTPTGGYTGIDSFVYNSCDSLGACTPTTVTLRANTAPVGVADFYASRDARRQFAPGLLGNDSDAEGDSLQIGANGFPPIITYPSNGRVSLPYYDGSFSYGPTSGYVGEDSFVYNSCDSLGACTPTTVYLFNFPSDGAEDAGSFCPTVGQPINVTNGNMWLEQTDYSLPGVGENIEINRFYNSMIQQSGLFGVGWSTKYDESLIGYGDKMVRVNMSDGRAIYFGRANSTASFVAVSPGIYGQLVQNTDNTYTLTFKDGGIHYFSSVGKLLWQKDRNGNQTTLNYDVNRVLTGITDAFGRTLTMTVNLGLVTQISDSLGVVATYDYYPGTSRLKEVTYNDGSKYKFEYTTISNKIYLTTVKDALNNILETHNYDSSGRATTSEKQGGVEKYTLNYINSNDASPYTTVTDALGRVTKYYFDKTKGRNVVTKSEGVCSCGGSGSEVTQYFYDAKLNLTKKVDALGRQTLYTYDGNGNRLSMTDVLGTETYSYNSFGEILTRNDRMNGVTTNTYNATGNLLTTKDALNFTTTLTYDARGQIQTVKDARNNTTTLTYDTFGRLTQVTDANNKPTNFAYDARVRLTSATNAVNFTTSFQYDLANRLNKITHPDATFMSYTYDLAGRRTAMTDERGNTTNYGYDTAYRLISMTDALNNTMTYGYDLMSNLVSQRDALMNTTNYQYDDFNRLKKAIYPPSVLNATRLEESLTYNTVGKVKTRTDTAGRATNYDYDTANRLIKTTDALNQITQFEYNPRSQLTKVKDALNQDYVFTYDALGRQLSQTRAGTTMSYQYDAVGNRTKRTDYTGRVTDYSYDVLNRLTQIAYVNQSGSNASYNYDDLSRLTSAVNDNGTVSFTYDNRNRITNTTDVFNYLVEYGYDANSNRTQLKLDSSIHTTYAYDITNRLTTLTDETSQDFTFGYDIANKLISKTLPNGVSTTFDYDGMSRLTRLKHQSSSATLTDNQYAYNTANQINQIAELAQTKNFSYDNVDRLTAMTNGTANESYAFDGVGNRTSSHLSASYNYQPFNRMTATASRTMSYDANGNMISKTDGLGSWIYVWDYENRMTSATNGTNSVSYNYDALGRRVKRTEGANLTKYTYDGLDVVLDDENGVLTKYQNGLGIDNKLKLTSNGVSRYFLQDHLGSTVGLADSSGNITSSASYDSFGNSTNNLTTRYQYTGREYDSLTGLTYYRARWYDANLGRFISEDPIGFEGGDVNLYGYVKNKPLNFFDPFGLDEYAMMERLANQQPSNRSVGEMLDELQLMLGGLGLIPGLGEPFDAADGVISLARGNYGDATLSGASMLPFAGMGAGLTKICNRADNLPKGGVYRLFDPDTGDVMRTGRTKDLAKRRKDHARDPKLKDFEFDPVHKTDNYNEQRGLEDILYNNYPNAPFNFTPALSKRNKNRQKYLDAASNFLERQD